MKISKFQLLGLPEAGFREDVCKDNSYSCSFLTPQKDMTVKQIKYKLKQIIIANFFCR